MTALAAGEVVPSDVQTSPQMGSQDFERIRSRIRSQCGIVLKEHKRPMVQTRVLERVITNGFESFADYLDFLDKTEEEGEIESFCNALTTNLTSFFRENHHFEHFSKELKKLKEATPNRLRIWSAGCSTGEEAYSIAMMLAAEDILQTVPNTRILATDIDTGVLRTAAAATYGLSDLSQIPKSLSGTLTKIRSSEFEFVGDVQKLISFRRLNLLQDWPMTGSFDIIFCRNVMIYFSSDTKADLVSKFAKFLRPGGILYLGHSETILGDHPLLQNEGNTIYRRTMVE